MNPLHPEGWFALGYCALKERDYSRAAQAFSRAAQQQPDNGDAWNNLAAIHLQVPHILRAHQALCCLPCPPSLQHVWQRRCASFCIT